MSQMSSNQFLASAYTVATKSGLRTVREFSSYPKVPATYPNREVRRLVARKKFHLLPAPWAAVVRPKLHLM